MNFFRFCGVGRLEPHSPTRLMSFLRRLGCAIMALSFAGTIARSQVATIGSPSGSVVAAGVVTISGTVGTSSTTVAVAVINTSGATVASGSGVVTGTSWSFSGWTPTVVGTYTIRATPTLSSVTGTAVTTSISVTGIYPTVSVTVAGGGTSIPVGSSRYVKVTATDDGSIDYIHLYLDGSTVVATKTGAPYNFLFTAPALPGLHTLMAVAVDNVSLQVNSPVVNIEIANAIGVPPTVGISAPFNGAFVPVGVASTISGTASDSDGVVNSVQIFGNGESLGTVTPAGGVWSFNWTPSASGAVAITALATDDRGNAIISPASTVTVTDSSSPAVVLTASPGSTTNSAMTLPAGATRYLNAAVTPMAGRAPVRVEFFVNGTKIGEKTAASALATNAGAGTTTSNFTFKYTAPAAPGIYNVVARATDNAGASRDTQLTLNVVSAVGAPPIVALLAPSNNASVVPNVAVNLAATAASSAGGTITGVQFYQNGIAIGNPVVATPFVANFTPAAPGAYAIEAIATDDRGNTAVSSTVNITAAFGTPTVSLTAPRDGTRVTPGVPVTLTATAVGGSGAAITLVEFFIDGASLGVDSTAPYSIAWTPDTSQLGAHQLTARVTDANSLTATSNVIAVTVASVTGSPPTVAISAPTGNAATTIQTLSSVNLVANAFDTDGTIASVEFFLADTSVGLAAREQTSNVYRLVYNFSNVNYAALTPDANGRYIIPLYAIARDNSGNQSISTTVNLTANPSQSSAPSVTITSSIATVTAGTALQLVGNAIDPDGTIASVQYFANGTAIATSTTGPLYTVNYTPTTAGRFNVYGVATDDTGNTAVSASVVINVTGNTAPTAILVRPSDNATVTNTNAPVFLEATAADADAGQTLTVVFLGNGTQIAAGQRVGTTNTYRAVWTPTIANTYAVTARSSDSAGAQTVSTASRNVVVNNLVGLAPVVTINVPGTVTTNSTVNFNATATDADGIVTAVEFFVNRSSIGQAVRDQTSNIWRINTSFAGLPTGATEVVAIASDTSGNLAASGTTNINVVNSTSAAPTINIAADKTTVAFSQPVQLSANAFDADGTVSSVQYFANGVSVGTSTVAPSYLLNWTATASGTFSVYALATDNTGNTAIAAPFTVTVKRNNPIIDDDAFILQTYQDILVRNPNAIELANSSAQIAAGTTTRAQLAAALAADPAFNNNVNLCAVYYLLMNEWPTYTNYQTLYASRNNLATVIGLILGSPEYIFKYGSTTAATLNASYANAYTPFATRLWQSAFGRAPTALELVQFHDNDTVVLAPPIGPIGRGYTVAGLNTAIAEFITVKNSTNTTFLNLARSAALYYQLLKAQPTAAQVTALAALSDTTAIASSLLGSSLYTYRYVTITTQPVALTVSARSGALFRVAAVGQPPLAYQWLFNGAPIAGATNPLLSVTNVDTTKTGSYSAVVTSAVASTTSDPALLTLSVQPTRLGNISTRGVAGTGANVLTAGFVVTGTATKQMLIRVIGPSLSGFGVAGVLPDPNLTLLNSAGVSVQTNDNWGTQSTVAATNTTLVSAIQQATNRLGAFNLANNSLDSVILATLNPGSYTVQARGAGTSTGVALIEVYDASTTLTGPKAINVSTRGNVGTGENILIAGFVVNGTVSRRLLIRGVGLTLANFGLPAASLLPDPQLKLLNGAGVTLATNDNWAAGDDAAVIAAASTAAGAFPLANGSKDSAIIIMLAPGAYTAQLSGVGSTNNTGIALVEVYDVDP